MDIDEKVAAFEEYVIRSVRSQNGWGGKNGPYGHLTPAERLNLAYLRAEVRIFLLEHPPPRIVNDDLPF